MFTVHSEAPASRTIISSVSDVLSASSLTLSIPPRVVTPPPTDNSSTIASSDSSMSHMKEASSVTSFLRITSPLLASTSSDDTSPLVKVIRPAASSL